MFIDMLDMLMNEKGINKSVLAKESGIPYTTIDGWYKKGNEDIRLSTLKKLCAYFNVSLDYIMESEVSQKEKAPAQLPELNGDLVSTEDLTRLLVNLGFIRDGEDLTDDDFAFLSNIIGLLSNWFSRKGR